VSYATSAPVKTPQGWYFGGAVVQGSGAVSRGGFDATVTQGASSAAFASYTGVSRLPLERGADYHFLITVEGNGPLEQYVGSFKALQQDISVVLTNVTVTKSSVKQQPDRNSVLFANKSGRFTVCASPHNCDNAPDVIGLMVTMQPEFGQAAPVPTSWTATSGLNSGVGKITIDTRMISMDRPMRSVIVKSMPGDIEFEAVAEIHVTWH